MDTILADKGAKALFMFSGSFKDANMYYMTKFLAPDPFIFLKKVDENPILVVNQMEYPRAQKESVIEDVRSYNDYNLLEIVKASPEPRVGFLKFLSSLVGKELGFGTGIYVTPQFPAIIADYLRKEKLTLMPLFNVTEKARETKETEEIDEIRKVQEAVERATRTVLELVNNAEVSTNKTLVVGKGKDPLTVGKIKSLYGHAFLDYSCLIEEEIIVACGPKGANPHYFGNPEDVLKADQPIILDVYPKSFLSRYCTDMTRTIVKGKASAETKRMFEAVLEARAASLDSLCAGTPGKEAYDACCNSMEKAGYMTSRGGKKTTKGFTHGLGHGVGLQVHEGPALGELSKSELEEHNIVTIEPGLYDPKIGGVRIEDIVEITKTGHNNLTKMKIELEI